MFAFFQCSPDLVTNLESELPSLKEASQISFDEIKNSLKTLSQNRQKLEKQLEQRAGDAQFQQFLELIKIDCAFELKEFDKSYQCLQANQLDLAAYFCENRNTFQLDECFKIFTFLMNRLHQAHKEHVLRENRKARKEEKKEKEKEKAMEKAVVERKKENVDLFETLSASKNYEGAQEV